MITATSLREYTVKDLGQMAKDQGVSGWHSMRKDQLIRALVRMAKSSSSKKKKPAAKAKTARATGTKTRTTKAAAPKSKPRSTNGSSRRRTASPKISAASARVAKKISRERDKREKRKDLAQDTPTPSLSPRRGNPVLDDDDRKDRIVLLVRDAYWLHACWEVSRHSVVRARAAMAERWHTCRPVIRVFQVESSGANAAERVLRDIEIHGGVKNWYIDVNDPPQSYRCELGYVSSDGQFFSIARSNTVTTPKPGSSDAIDENWTEVAENYEKIYAQSTNDEHSVGELRDLFEERLRRPMGNENSYGVGAERLVNRDRDFEFEVDAEIILFGKTKPNAQVVLSGEPVKLRPDGTFTVRLSMPDRRQVLPVVASSLDGVEQRTVVLAVERNTKVMEPVVRENVD